ncbi:MAG: divergent polysaccharide deacetylase family protein [Acidobacteria bacterium]|nr:divergent polysaccharide deacetylase family protein [Acidobacteriota bacterium]
MATKRRPKRSSKKSATSPVVLRIVLTAIVLIALGGITYLAFFSGGSALSTERAGEIVLLSFSEAGVPATAVHSGIGDNGHPVFRATMNPTAANRFQKVLKQKIKGVSASLSARRFGKSRLLLLKSGDEVYRIILEGAVKKGSTKKAYPSVSEKKNSAHHATKKLTFLETHKGEPQVVIILDDVGLGHMSTFKKALNIPYPLTFAIIPFRRYSRECAAMARGRGFDMMVHMPMEPDRYPAEDPGPGAIFEKDSRELIEKKIQAAIDNIQYAVGMNNHMGSKATSVPFTMRVVMRKLKQQGLFFIDSRTTAETVALHEARSAGVPSLPRNVFLDNSRKPKDIRRQLEHALKEAEKKGYVIAIGHNYPETVEVLAKELPLLDRKVNFVYARELVNEAGKPN